LFQESINITGNNYLYTSKRTALQKLTMYVYNSERTAPQKLANSERTALKKLAMHVFLNTFSQNILAGVFPKTCKFYQQ
jgi:hypothetical protein